MNGCPWGVPTTLGSRIPLASLIQTLAVAEHLSFYRAAQALGTSQSNVSARIKALEQDLGILLFERNTRGVRLTEAGRLFVERVAAGVDQLDHAVKTAGMAASGECGRLRVGIHALMPRSFLAELIAQFREDHPGIDVEITEGTAREAVMQLRADRLDVAFVAEGCDANIEAWIAGTEARAGREMAEGLRRHVAKEYSTYTWILEGMLERAGLRIERAEHPEGVLAHYYCTRG